MSVMKKRYLSLDSPYEGSCPQITINAICPGVAEISAVVTLRKNILGCKAQL
jgi:hypothetical protein